MNVLLFIVFFVCHALNAEITSGFIPTPVGVGLNVVACVGGSHIDLERGNISREDHLLDVVSSTVGAAGSVLPRGGIPHKSGNPLLCKIKPSLHDMATGFQEGFESMVQGQHRLAPAFAHANPSSQHSHLFLKRSHSVGSIGSYRVCFDASRNAQKSNTAKPSVEDAGKGNRSVQQSVREQNKWWRADKDQGVQTAGSKSIYTDHKTGARLDVENPNPADRPGQIHLQTKDGKKYMFDIDNKSFYLEGNQDKPVPKSIIELGKDPAIQKALEKGLRILGVE